MDGEGAGGAASGGWRVERLEPPRYPIAGLGLILVTVACIRLTEHEGPWHCEDHSDCLSEEKCSSGVCVDIDHCETSTSCPEDHRCIEARCVKVECTTRLEPDCMPYLCDTYSWTCETDCTRSGCIAGFACEGGKCVAFECYNLPSYDECHGYACVDGICNTTCLYGSDCHMGFTCRNGNCLSEASTE